MAIRRFRVLRPLLWLTLLLVVALLVQSVVVAHRTRTRGLPGGFPAPVAEADVPILGVNVALEQYDDEGLEAALNRIAEGGFVWLRQSFHWSQIEPQPGRFDWTAPDRALAALARYPQLRLVAVLDDQPPTPPTNSAEFAAFAETFAARYGAQVDYYQVWDEPNLADHWGGGPVNPRAYADLLARAARAIRRADPSARVLLAGLAPTIETGPQNLSDVRYLEQLYQVGAAPYFDVVVGKPYGFDTGPDDRRVDETLLNFSRLLLLREVMVSYGDTGTAIWASHWGWNALPPGWTGAPSTWGQTDERTQAARTVAGLERARDEWPWVGAMILEHFQPDAPADDPRWGFALVEPDSAPRPVYHAVYRALAAWAAALPDAAPVGGYPALNRWATYEGNWRVGPLGADVGSDGDRATFRFDGAAVALTVRRGPYRAFLYVTLDGGSANNLPQDAMGRSYVVLYDSQPGVATIPLATGLSSGPHTVEVTAAGGQGQWALVDWRVGAAPVRESYGSKIAGLAAAGLILLGLLVHDARRVAWPALGRRFLGWPEWTQVALIVGLAGLLWTTAGASWGRDYGSPWFVVSMLTLPALMALVALRLDLGLALVAFTAPFYLHPGDMFYRALGLPELLVVLCGIGMLVRWRRGVGGTGRRGDRGTRGQEAGGKGQEAGSSWHERLRAARAANTAPSQSVIGGLWSVLSDGGCFRNGEQGTRARRRVAFSCLDLSVVSLVVAAVVSGVMAADWRAALLELRSVFLLPALYYALLRLVHLVRLVHLDEGAMWRVVDGWALGGLGVALVGLVQYALGRNVVVAEGGLPRLQSVYFSPNNVGLYLGRIWPLLVAVALCRLPEPRRALYALALVPVTLALVLSFSRGALLLGLPAALLVMGWRAGGRVRWAAVALVVIGALALIPLLRLPRFAAMFDLEQGSTFFRLELWRSSLTMIRQHPWFGVGPGNFPAAYRTRYILPGAWQEPNLEHPHNVYLDHWTRLGVLGLLAGVALQVTFWRAYAGAPSHSSRLASPSLARAGPTPRRRSIARRNTPC